MQNLTILNNESYNKMLKLTIKSSSCNNILPEQKYCDGPYTKLKTKTISNITIC